MSLFKRAVTFLLSIALALSLFALPAYAEEKEIGPYGSWAEWTDIKSLCAGGNILYGIKNDGSVAGCCVNEGAGADINASPLREVLAWQDVTSLSMPGYEPDCVLGLTADGAVLFNSPAEKGMRCETDDPGSVKEMIRQSYPPMYYLLLDNGTVSGITVPGYSDGTLTGFENASDISDLWYNTWSGALAVTGSGKNLWPEPSDPANETETYLYDLKNSITAGWENIEKAFCIRNNNISLALGRKSDGSTCCKSFYEYDSYEKRRMPYLEHTIESWENIQDIGYDYYAEDLIAFTDDGAPKGVKTFQGCVLNETDGTYAGREKFSLIGFRDLDVAGFQNGNILLSNGEYFTHGRDSSTSYSQKLACREASQLKQVAGSMPNIFGITEEGAVVSLTLDEYEPDPVSAELTDVQPGEPGNVNLWGGSYNFEFRLEKETESCTSEDGFVYKLLDNEAYITGYKGEAPDGQFSIPDSVGGHKVVYVSGIECGAQDVLIPDTVKAVSLRFSKAAPGRVLLPSSVLGYEAYYDNCPLPEIIRYDAASPAGDAAA